MIVFAYGTLAVPWMRERVLGHPVDARPAVLRGHSAVRGEGYPTLVRSDGEVRGVVFEASDEDVLRMDVWEEVPVYVLVPVTVYSDGTEVLAHAYVMPEPPEGAVPVGDGAGIPSDSVVAGDLDRLVGRPCGTRRRPPR